MKNYAANTQINCTPGACSNTVTEPKKHVDRNFNHVCSRLAKKRKTVILALGMMLPFLLGFLFYNQSKMMEIYCDDEFTYYDSGMFFMGFLIGSAIDGALYCLGMWIGQRNKKRNTKL